MNVPTITNTIPIGARMPQFIRNSLRARILTGIGIMLLPLLGLAAGALLGINSVIGSFKDVVEEVSGEMEPIMAVQIAILQAAMPANDYLIHGERTERDKFARLSQQVEHAFKRLEAAPFGLVEERALTGSAHDTWQQAQSISETVLALSPPVDDAAGRSEVKRIDALVDHAVDLLSRVREVTDAEIAGGFAKATATGRTVLQIVFGAFGLGFTVVVSVGAALAWSILTRVKALSDGARAFGEGNLSYRVQLEGHDELGRLACVFNGMAAELDHTHQALRETSIRDSLTGLYNRREFDRRLREELKRCNRYHHPLSLLLLDLDHFKAINDGYGHPVGDKVLREVADIVKHEVRDSDEVVARYGGEEFAVIMPETDKLGAGVLAQRIRAAITAYTFSADETQPLSVTASIGLAGFPNDAYAGETLIAAADRALYHAKRTGRNRVCSFDPEQGMENPR